MYSAVWTFGIISNMSFSCDLVRAPLKVAIQSILVSDRMSFGRPKYPKFSMDRFNWIACYFVAHHSNPSLESFWPALLSIFKWAHLVGIYFSFGKRIGPEIKNMSNITWHFEWIMHRKITEKSHFRGDSKLSHGGVCVGRTKFSHCHRWVFITNRISRHRDTHNNKNETILLDRMRWIIRAYKEMFHHKISSIQTR